MGRKRTKNEKVMGKTVKIGPTLSKSIIVQNRPILGAMFMHRVFSTHDKLVYKFETLRKKVTLATTCNSQIAKNFPSQAGISIGKWPSVMENTLTPSIRGVISHKPKLGFSQDLWHSEGGIISFLRTPRSSKIDTESYINCARENWRKQGNYAGNPACFSSRKGCLHT